MSDTQKTLIANWKSNKTLQEAQAWLDRFDQLLAGESSVAALCKKDGHTIAIAVPDPYLLLVRSLTNKYPFIKVCAQNVSMFGMGSYTGEVSARAMADIVSYCLVGHSERRHWFGEESAQIQSKIDLLVAEHVTPVVCIRSLEDIRMLTLNDEVMVAYEPDEAIGSGLHAPVSQVVAIARQLPGVKAYLYGGSVDSQNIADYMRESTISGVLVGRSSLDADAFYHVAESALI